MTTVLSHNASTELDRTLAETFRRAGCHCNIVARDWTRWASATFTGARHELTIECPAGAGLDALLDEFPDDLPMRGHLVADIIVTSVRRSEGFATIRLEALTVEL